MRRGATGRIAESSLEPKVQLGAQGCGFNMFARSEVAEGPVGVAAPEEDIATAHEVVNPGPAALLKRFGASDDGAQAITNSSAFTQVPTQPPAEHLVFTRPVPSPPSLVLASTLRCSLVTGSISVECSASTASR